jgi:hypothetical protein
MNTSKSQGGIERHSKYKAFHLNNNSSNGANTNIILN